MGYVGQAPTAAVLTADDITDGIIANADIASDAAIALSKTALSAGTGVTLSTNTLNVDAAQTGITSIYATDLILGEDSQTAIDFGTADEIDFKINNTAELTLSATSLYPIADAGLDLGTTALGYNDLHLGASGVLNFDNANMTITHSTGVLTVAGGTFATAALTATSFAPTLDISLADDKKIIFGDGSDASIEYDENGTDQLRIAGNTIFENQVQYDKDILLDSTPADTVYSGITAQFTAGEDLEDGECVYLKAADTKMWKAVSNTGGTGLISAEIMCVAMCVADVSADATGTFLLQGFIRADTNFPTYAVGETLYVPEAEVSGKNVPEGAVPDTDGDFVQVIGWAADANTVFFNPDFTVIEHA